jgi:uncharacterized membrane protein
MSVIDLVVQLALQITLTAWVVRRDMWRTPPAQLVRAWNDASFWSAVVMFGPLCIPVHFVRTRRSFAGLVVGIAWMIAVLVALWLVGEAIAWLSSLVGS